MNTFQIINLLIALSIIFSCGPKQEKDDGKELTPLIESSNYREVADMILKGSNTNFSEEEILRTAVFFSEKTAFQISIPLFRKALEKYPNNTTAKLILANNLRERNEFNEAIKYYNDLAEIDSIQFIVLPERARLYTLLDELEKAERDIEIAKNLQPKYFAIYLADGLLQNHKGRQQEAVDLFDVAIDLDPGVSSEANFYEGIILLRNGLNYDALGKFTDAIEVGKNINLGYAFINRGISQLNLMDTAFACQDFDSGYYYMPEQAKVYIDKYCQGNFRRPGDKQK